MVLKEIEEAIYRYRETDRKLTRALIPILFLPIIVIVANTEAFSVLALQVACIWLAVILTCKLYIVNKLNKEVNNINGSTLREAKPIGTEKESHADSNKNDNYDG